MPDWPQWSLLHPIRREYRPASSHSSAEEFRARMKRRQEDAERQRIERERRECDERYDEPR